VLVALVVAVLGAGTGAPRSTLARLTNTDASTMSTATDQLNPPTSLAASAGTSVSLSWVATVDAYASGYEVWRSTVNGTGYSLAGSVTPRSATTTGDTPGSPGTYYYVLRSFFQNWRSVNSNQASATIVGSPVDTGQKACVTTAPDTGGNGNGYETNPSRLCTDDSSVASDVSSGSSGRSTACANAANDRHRFAGFAFGLPASVTSVSGIEVRVDEGLNNNGGTSVLCVELSWDGGTTWTATKSVTLNATAETTYLFGGSADTWGHTWTSGQVSTSNFRVRVIDATSQSNKDFRMDFLAARVVYQP